MQCRSEHWELHFVQLNRGNFEMYMQFRKVSRNPKQL